MEDRRQFLKKFPPGCFVPTDNMKKVSTTEHPAKKTTFTNSPFRESSFDVHAEQYLRRTGHPELGGKKFRSTLTLVFDSEPPQEVMSTAAPHDLSVDRHQASAHGLQRKCQWTLVSVQDTGRVGCDGQ